MNLDKFVETLPKQYLDWGTPDVRPIDNSIELRSRVWAMTVSNNMRLLNHAVSFLEDDEIYLEVGVLKGASTMAAMMNNTARGIAVDNFCMLESDEGNKNAFLRNMRESGIADRVTLCEQDFVEFFQNPPAVKVGSISVTGHTNTRGRGTG